MVIIYIFNVILYFEFKMNVIEIEVLEFQEDWDVERFNYFFQKKKKVF